jgi:hypothetical protein
MTAAAERADQLLAMARRLIVLVEREVEAMKARRLDGASADFEEKERLAHAYRLEIGHIKANPDLLAGISNDQKLALRDASSQLEALLTAHAATLAAMKDVTEGLVRSIATEVAIARSAPAGYGRSGAVVSGARPEASGLTVNAKA